MRHIELHILQSVPVSCLNRDDLNSPKTAVFGGVPRARVSSQSWKRAVRELAKELSPKFEGRRTRLIMAPLKESLLELGCSEEDALAGAKALANALAKLDDKAPDEKVRTMFFTSPAELKAIASKFKETGDVKKSLRTNGSTWCDAADIALFGRMVANDPSLTVEGAAMFSHALSTHRAESEIDFFAAVDDLQGDDEAGAGMTGTLEFSSAAYYRFAAVNLDMLANEDHLAGLEKSDRAAVLKSFVEAILRAVPGARRNSMNANTVPGYALLVAREKGHPVQLVNAFEKPVYAHNGKGLMELSIDAIKEEREDLSSKWGVDFSRIIEVGPGFSGTVKDLLDKVEEYAI